jgi:hypothetical protein
MSWKEPGQVIASAVMATGVSAALCNAISPV